MRTFYTFIRPFLFLLMLSSCDQNDIRKDLKALNSFLYENYKTNEKVLKNELEEYKIRCEEQPQTQNPKLDVVYSKYKELTPQISERIVSKNTDVKAIQYGYEKVLNALELIVQNHEGYTINRILSNANASQLDSEYQLQIMRNNLVMAMSYAFEYVNNPPNSFRQDIANLTQVDSEVSQLYNRTRITLSAAALQIPSKNKYVSVDRILLNDSEIDTSPEILNNTAFGTIILDSLQSGKYFIQGKLRLHKDKNIFDMPFLQKFEVR
ncbi:MAG: hypothetical protein AAF611_22060 [Bacteroidota bacterium]